jgi:hypothetical protein
MLKVNFYNSPAEAMLMSYLCQLQTTVGKAVEAEITTTLFMLPLSLIHR